MGLSQLSKKCNKCAYKNNLQKEIDINNNIVRKDEIEHNILQFLNINLKLGSSYEN